MVATFRNFALAILFLSWPLLTTAQTSFIFEPSDAKITGLFVVTNDYLWQPVQTEFEKGGRATFEFTLTNGGTYALVCQVDAPSPGTNSLYVNIDNEPQHPEALWEIPGTRGFENRVVFWPENVTPGLERPRQKNFELDAGPHKIILRGHTGNIRIARVILRMPPAPPGPPRNLRVVGGP